MVLHCLVSKLERRVHALGSLAAKKEAKGKGRKGGEKDGKKKK